MSLIVQKTLFILVWLCHISSSCFKWDQECLIIWVVMIKRGSSRFRQTESPHMDSESSVMLSLCRLLRFQHHLFAQASPVLLRMILDDQEILEFRLRPETWNVLGLKLFDLFIFSRISLRLLIFVDLQNLSSPSHLTNLLRTHAEHSPKKKNLASFFFLSKLMDP